jgi:hypothetical protein
MRWVIERARLLVETNAVQAGYLPSLRDLATMLLACEDQETAANLIAVALATAPPRLLPSHLTAIEREPADPWRGPPPSPQVLAPIRRGTPSTVRDAPTVRRWEGLDAFTADEEAARRERQGRLDRIFGWGERCVVEMPLRESTDIALLLNVVGRCLEASDCCWRGEDGSLITVLNPEETRMALLPTQAGTYVLAPYRLYRRSPGDASHVP